MQNRDRLIDSKQNDIYGEGLGGEGIRQKGKRTHGHGQQCGDCGGVCIREINGNGEKYSKKVKYILNKRKEKKQLERAEPSFWGDRYNVK